MVLKIQTFLFIIFLSCFLANPGVSQQVVTGNVIDADDGESLPGVNITLPDYDVGTTTGVNGEYELTLPDGAEIIRFSYLGYEAVEEPIDGRDVIDIALEPITLVGDDLIVTAFGMQREEKSIGYSVQDLRGEELTSARELNLGSALQGRFSNVHVTDSPTGPGGSTRIVLRGASSLQGSNQPLIVLNGVPMDNSGGMAAGTWGGFDYGNVLNDINASDIEDISILTGPNAAARYGSRAASGVIEITTRSGEGVTGIGLEFSSNVTFDQPYILPDFQNQYGRGVDGKLPQGGKISDGITSSWGAPMDGREYINFRGEESTFSPQSGRMEDFLQTAWTATNMLALSGGGEGHNYRVSYTNMSNEGIYPDSRIDQHSFSLNAGKNFGDRFDADVSFNYMDRESFNRPPLANDPDNIVLAFYKMPRNIALGDLEDYRRPNGFPVTWDNSAVDEFSGSQNQNPFWTYNLNTNEDSRTRFYGNTTVRYHVNDWMSLMTRVGLDWYEENRSYRRAQYTIFQPSGGRAFYSLQSRTVEEINSMALLEINRDLTEEFELDVSAGGSFRNFDEELIGYNANGLDIPGFFYINNAIDRGTAYLNNKNQIHSVMAFGELAYRNYAFLEASVRTDWSSTLPLDNNPFTYPSISATFTWTEALDMISEVLTFGNLRLSWAEVGNDAPPYVTNYGYSVSEGHAGQAFANVPGSLPAIDLKPEITRSWEIGHDLRLFTERLRFDATFYRDNTENQILGAPITVASGYGRAIINAGDIQNQGVELSLEGAPVQTADFQWDVNLNWSRNRNEIKELHDDLNTYELGGIHGVIVRADLGEQFGDLYGQAYQRNEEGRRIIGENGIPLVEDEPQKLGNYTPDWSGGLQNRIDYRNISLSVLFDYSYGGEVYSLSNAFGASRGHTEVTLEGREEYYAGEGGYVAEGVVRDEEEETWQENEQPVNPQNYWEEVGGRSPVTEEFIYDASYLRLQEVVLGYNLPSHLVERLGMMSANISLTGRNLLYLFKDTPGFTPVSTGINVGNAQGFDAFGFPPTRNIGFNINLRF